jgi:uncharacterized protein (DUF952 family)
MARSEIIYKLMTRSEWEAAQASGTYCGSHHDLRDGYIHFSTARQVVETGRKYFSGVPDLVLLAVAVEALESGPLSLGDKLQWEPSRGGDLFPHLYADLPTSAVRSVVATPLANDGTPLIPEGIAE